MSKILVIIPTFDNGPTLRPAIHGVLHQSEQDVQVVVIGDGAPPSTDSLMDEMCAADHRVHYVPRPKSPRTGEPYRDEIIRATDAEFVLYSSDDDIWMPDHAEVLCRALADHDLAATLSIGVNDRLYLSRMDYSDPTDRALELTESRVGLTESGHRMDSYLRLPVGWRTAPPGRYTDHWMWCQWLEQPWVRATTVPEWTVVHIPKPLRLGVPGPDREKEQWRWAEEFSSPDWRQRRSGLLRAALLEERRTYERHANGLESHLKAATSRLDEMATQLAAESALRVEAEQRLGAETTARLLAEERLTAESAGHDRTATSLLAIESSRTWITAQRLARVSGWNSIRRRIHRA